jgi:hypothetical protein
MCFLEEEEEEEDRVLGCIRIALDIVASMPQ